MINRNKNKLVYMDYVKTESGFTLFSVILITLMISLMLPIIASIITTTKYTTNYQEISVSNFFQFLRDESLLARNYEIVGDTLILELADGRKSSFKLYKDYILRQVNGEGHEVYLRDVRRIRFVPLKYGIQTTVTSLTGDQYEKTIVFYD